ncbi:MAG: alpha/beta hydrolase family protein, partial [Planctomycetia bacterium]
ILFDPTGVGREFIATAIGERLSVPSIFNVQRMYDDPDRRRRFRRDPLALRWYDTRSYFDYLTYQPDAAPADLNARVLLLHGSNDRLVSADYERRVYDRLRDAGADAALAVVPGASHAVLEEEAEPAAAVIVDWLTSSWSDHFACGAAAER